MTTHRIDSNNSYVTEVSVGESDPYTKLVYMKLVRDNLIEEVRGVNEMFMTSQELRELGQFLVDQADAIESEQNSRTEFAQKTRINQTLELRGSTYRLG